MNQELIKFLKILVIARREQPADSSYFDPQSGGTYSTKLAGRTGLTFQEVEAKAAELAQMGYAKILTRKADEVSKGIFVTDSAVAFIEGVEEQERQAAEQQAEIDAKIAEDKRVDMDFNRAKDLGWNINKTK